MTFFRRRLCSRGNRIWTELSCAANHVMQSRRAKLTIIELIVVKIMELYFLNRYFTFHCSTTLTRNTQNLTPNAVVVVQISTVCWIMSGYRNLGLKSARQIFWPLKATSSTSNLILVSLKHRKYNKYTSGTYHDEDALRDFVKICTGVKTQLNFVMNVIILIARMSEFVFRQSNFWGRWCELDLWQEVD